MWHGWSPLACACPAWLPEVCTCIVLDCTFYIVVVRHYRIAVTLLCVLITILGLRAADRGSTSDPYAVVSVGAAFGNRKTAVIPKCLDPAWDAEFMFTGAGIDDVEMLHVEVYDKVLTE